MRSLAPLIVAFATSVAASVHGDGDYSSYTTKSHDYGPESSFTFTTVYPTSSYDHSYSDGACPTVTETATVCPTCPVLACLVMSTVTNSCHCPAEIPTTYLSFGCETACTDNKALGCYTTYQYATATCVGTTKVTDTTKATDTTKVTDLETMPTIVTDETITTAGHTGFSNSTTTGATSHNQETGTASATETAPSQVTGGATRVAGNLVVVVAGVAALLL